MEEKDYLEKKDENKTYISKSFSLTDFSTKKETNKRYVKKMFSMKNFPEFIRNKDKIFLYSTPNQKQEIIALIDEDTKDTYFTLQRFTSDTYSPHKFSFSFGLNQLDRINKFVESLPYINFSNKEKFKINDSDLKTKIDKIKFIEKSFNDLSEADLAVLLSSKKLAGKDFVNIAYRKNGLEIFRKLLEDKKYFEETKKEKGVTQDEKLWQLFFEKHDWIFGYGLDYRFMSIFDREMSVGNGGTEDRGKPKTDFLNEYNDFTVLVELKTPNTQFFNNSEKSCAGCWRLSTDFINAYSQVLEQKAEWQIKGDKENNLNKQGDKKLRKRTRDPKIILLIGSKKEQILNIENIEEKELKQDTFELFRRDSRNVEIITYDELYERADFIVNEKRNK